MKIRVHGSPSQLILISQNNFAFVFISDDHKWQLGSDHVKAVVSLPFVKLLPPPHDGCPHIGAPFL